MVEEEDEVELEVELDVELDVELELELDVELEVELEVELLVDEDEEVSFCGACGVVSGGAESAIGLDDEAHCWEFVGDHCGGIVR